MLATKQFGLPLTFILWTKPEYLFLCPTEEEKKVLHVWNEIK